MACLQISDETLAESWLIINLKYVQCKLPTFLREPSDMQANVAEGNLRVYEKVLGENLLICKATDYVGVGSKKTPLPRVSFYGPIIKEYKISLPI